MKYTPPSAGWSEDSTGNLTESKETGEPEALEKLSGNTTLPQEKNTENNTHTQKVIEGDQVKEGNKVTAKERKAWGIHSCYIRAKKKS